MRKKKYSFREIAGTLKRSVSTIHTELKLNLVKNKYDPHKAQHKAYVRNKYSKYQSMKIVENQELQKYIEIALHDDLSPEQIAGRIKRKEKRLSRISKSSIYNYLKTVYGRKLEAYRKKKKWKKRRNKRKKVTELKDRVFIDKRPKYIQDRKRIGDIEADFVVSGKSGKGILLSIADRKSRIVFLERIIEVSIRNMEKSFVKINNRFPEMKTITTDNDLLFQNHKRLELLLQVKIYFCHPYSSWEKGSVENSNGLVRRVIPKGSDISKYSERFIKRLEKKLNNRPRKCLKFETPLEMLEKHRERIRALQNKKSVCSD